MKKIERTIKYSTIGIIHSLFKSPEGMPIQQAGSSFAGSSEVFPEYRKGLKDVESCGWLEANVHKVKSTKDDRQVCIVKCYCSSV